MRRRAGIIITVAAAAVWVAALLATPPAWSSEASGPRVAAALVYTAASLVCHQRSERSFHYAGAKVPVCARCLGAYIGSLLGACAWMLFSGAAARPNLRSRRIATRRTLTRALWMTAVPTLASVATGWLGLLDEGNALRAALALPLGGTIAAVVTAVAAGDLE
jgi:uncharacterized membrane protein